MTSPAQLRAARSLLGLTQAQVAEAAGLSVPTVKRAEGDGAVAASAAAADAIQKALTRAGVKFIAENGGGLGVRLAKPKGR
ncbi:MAG TPA: helix-turn-helix domain-containing protein [Devosia sp.]|nr:helix-turn-helix domain-containing protein [Devosia sp.]